MSLLKNVWINFNKIQIKLKNKLIERKKQNFFKHDEYLVQKLSAPKRLPSLKQLNFISAYLSQKESFIIRILTGIIIIAVSSFILNFYWNNSQLVPTDGGKYTEGLVGKPQYINPLYAKANDVDLDLSSIIYSGLIEFSNNGIQNDLAEKYEIDESQKIYTFTLKQNIKWHDGEDFNADDVMFTFTRINNINTKTPLYFAFQGSTIEKIDDYTIRFTLEEPYAPFLESLSLGILPEHIWQDIKPENTILAQFNLTPTGTGPYKFKSFFKNKAGDIKSYVVEKNPDYYVSEPYIDEITFKFFDNFEEAVASLNNKNIDAISYLPKEIRSRIINNRNLNFNLLQQPQYTAIFFNYDKNPILKDVKIRKILSHAINKEKIINEILNAEAKIIDSPVLSWNLGFNPETTKYPLNLEQAKNELENAYWTLEEYKTETEEDDDEEDDDEENNEDTEEETDETAEDETDSTSDESTTEETGPANEAYPFRVRQFKDRYLEFNLTTVNQPETVKIAEELQKEWQQIGAKVNLLIVDVQQIASVIKQRDYEVLLYGQILGLDPDPFPFWHSSQRTFPGLNLSSYNNKEVDTLLEEARKTTDNEKRAEKYYEFQGILAEEIPAIFLYNPTYTYPQNKKIKGFDMLQIIVPSNRFNQIQDWYIKTKRAWKK